MPVPYSTYEAITLAKDTEMAEERNRTTGMRWVTAARVTRIASISGSMVPRLMVRALVAATVKPAKATVYAKSRTLIARNETKRFLCVSSLRAPHHSPNGVRQYSVL